MVCSYCGRTGHDKSSCWQIVGFPEGTGPSSNGRGRGGRGSSSSGGRGRGRVTAAHATSSNASSFPDFTPDQIRILTQLIHEKSGADTSDKLSGKIILGDVILDTGASHHMTGNLSLLTKVKMISPCSVSFADGNKTYAMSVGMLHLSDKITLQNVLFVSNLNCTLISVSRLLKQTNCYALFTDMICVLQDRSSRTLIGAGKERDGVYYFTDIVSATGYRTVGTNDQVLWHRRLGHPSFSVSSDLFSFSKSSLSAGSSPCDVCLRAKQTRDSFSESLNKTTSCFSLIHVDVWGPYRIPSSCGAVYFLTIVDDYSRAVWTFLLLAKSEVKRVLTQFLVFVERQFSTSVQTIRSDNGTEFMCLASYFRDHGIVHQTSCVATPQQNGRVERKHRHILNVARALLFQASVPVKFWGEAVLTAAYLINRTPTSLHKGKSPYEVLFNKRPDYSHLRVFGSGCYVKQLLRDKDKFAERSKLCVFMGYPFGTKGWRVFDMESNKFLVSRDVVFLEDTFPFGDKVLVTDQHTNQAVDDDWVVVSIDTGNVSLDTGTLSIDRGSDPSSSSHDTTVSIDPPIDTAVSIDPSCTPTVSIDSPNNPSVSIDTSVVSPDTNAPVSIDTGLMSLDTSTLSRDSASSSSPPPALLTPVDSTVAPRLGRGHRDKSKSVMLKDYVAYNVASDPNTHHALSSSTSSSSTTAPGMTLYPLSDFVSDVQFSEGHRAYLAAITSGVEPKHFKEAAQHKVWNDAMSTEVDALEINRTWDLVTLPPDKEAIGSQWVYKIKYNADGSIERYKARLVVQGNNQIEGEDYTDTFAPVIKMTTVRTVLRLVAAQNWEVFQMDVHNAFLHGDLTEEVYMKLPPGFRHSHPDKVCRLRKSLYGLKQAPRCWFKKLSDSLLKFGFVQSYDDYSLFSYSCKGIELRVLIYVDDLLICGNHSYMLRKFKEYLGRCFAMKDLGKLKYFLGIEVSRGSDGIFLSQRKYALDIVAETGNLGSCPAPTPLEQNHKLALSTGPLLADPKKYRRLLGRLIYLLNTRPELCYSVHVLSQFMQSPTEDHWQAALRVVRFLKGTLGQGILLKSTPDLSLTVYCDADWAACPVSRRSLSAFVVLLGGSPIAWKTKKQHTVSHSSAEAEYRSMAAALREIKWIRRLLTGLGIAQTSPTRLFCDSKAAIHIAANPVFHERTKHIETDCHAVRDAVRDGIITTEHVRTNFQLADILTKALGRVPFQDLVSKLGIHNLHAPT